MNLTIKESFTMHDHNRWMTRALHEARLALQAGELPIGGVLVGAGELVRPTQTAVRRRGSMVAHGELTALLDAGESIYTISHPLVLYTTLEPCLMCLGAMMQCDVDTVVYGMKCAPDGATRFVDHIRHSGQRMPDVVGGILETECVQVFKEWGFGNDHPAFEYVQAILAIYQ